MSHRYYSPLRPLSLGTFPKPQGNEILHIENFEERQNVPEIARQAWGYIEYKEALYTPHHHHLTCNIIERHTEQGAITRFQSQEITSDAG